MFRPLGQDKRITAPSLRFDDVSADLSRAIIVVNDPAEGLLNTEVQAIEFSVVRLVHNQVESERRSPRVLFRRVVSDGAAVHRDHALQSIPAIRGRSQTEPSSCWNLPNASLERDGRYVMTLVDHHESVFGSQLLEIFPAGETLNHSEIDFANLTVPTAAQLTDFLCRQAEVGGESISPLIDERFAINNHESRHIVMGDHRAGEHRLSRARWRDKHSEVLSGECFKGSFLLER
jgi:hypothetical protein